MHDSGNGQDDVNAMDAMVDLDKFTDFREVNIFLRGIIPLVGFKSTSVYYERHERIAGECYNPLRKMLHLAFYGITSLSVKPITIIAAAGVLFGMVGFLGMLWAIITALQGISVNQCCWLGVYDQHCMLPGRCSIDIAWRYWPMRRPRYIISERTWEPYERKYKGEE